MVMKGMARFTIVGSSIVLGLLMIFGSINLYDLYLSVGNQHYQALVGTSMFGLVLFVGYVNLINARINNRKAGFPNIFAIVFCSAMFIWAIFMN